MGPSPAVVRRLRARNELLFRQVNERIEQISGEERRAGELIILCECGHKECLEHVEIAPEDYEAVRRAGSHFVLLAGHEDPEMEDVVARHAGYVVVEKRGEAGELAERHDPRA
jgi:hypothetical protein